MGVKLVASSGGSVELVPTNTASNFTVTVPAGTGTVAVNGVSSNIVSGTAVASTSGTSIDFTGIPSWVKRITVMFSGVSTNGSSNLQIQIGPSGGVETTGYGSSMTYIVNATPATTNVSTGFLAGTYGTSGASYNGIITISTLSSSVWVMACNLNDAGSTRTFFGSGGKTITGTLDRVRITTVNGTDTFDAGSINILYE
jgi:hypothetical protein